ncbi:DUF3231 family protein [Bacillus sp. ISL-75]|uniref:DUF3231 family protein n=1 Tax=unclassified Bacillus (in: firmicutes) TaxID=185979 RepID=UPI001BECDFAF|nr:MULTISPECIES: DUF3231 family protein [unclassified Bacillus (in: firmicutes)]MBT2728813.1 DUF3231 family protein [Bacillus sp. ISL-75]MBT2741202.1 DUF3231 family protein [Bacillus sp. ISL-77]
MDLTNPLSASEVGTLWLTYQEKTLIIGILEYFIETSDEQQGKNLLGGLWQELNYYLLQMEQLFKEQGIVKPVGFTKEDVNLEAPKLYDNGFDIMFLRILKEVSMGMYTMNMNMAYNDQVMTIYEGLSATSQKIYKLSTLYLLEKGILSLPPKVTMPKTVEFIKNKSYMSGFNPFSDKRPLNDIELGILHHGIEANNIGFQLITGFAQCAKTKEVQAYFVKGMELAKKQIKEFQDILLESNVQFSATSGSTVTTSTIAPFSEKLMMNCIYLLNGFSIVGSSFGTFFTLRNDIITKNALIAKDIFFYGQEGIEIMIKHGWFEEPPQMEDRTGIIKQ